MYIHTIHVYTDIQYIHVYTLGACVTRVHSHHQIFWYICLHELSNSVFFLVTEQLLNSTLHCDSVYNALLCRGLVAVHFLTWLTTDIE